MTELDPPEDDNTRPLDPDEIACPRCHAQPGEVCRDPRGRKAKRLHTARRAAAAGTPPLDPNANTGQFDADRARAAGSAGGSKSAESKRRRAERIREEREARELAALSERAAELANDAARYDRQRSELRDRVFRVAAKAWQRAEQALDGLQVTKLDEDGRPALIVRELETDGGERVLRRMLDKRGAFTPADVKAIMTAAAIALDKLRLEEGKPTSRIGMTEEPDRGDPVEELGSERLAGLLDRARNVVDTYRPEHP